MEKSIKNFEDLPDKYDFDERAKEIAYNSETEQFSTGAIREDKSGKGRFELIPPEALFDLSHIIFNKEDKPLLKGLYRYHLSKDSHDILRALAGFITMYSDFPNAMLNLAIYYEKGAEKYGDDNWKKGIPIKSYYNSMLRHYFKYLRGDSDEDHFSAVLWNGIGAYWEA